MSPDLDELLRAARETTAADAHDPKLARETRDRVLATLRPRPTARRRLGAVAAAIAASLMGATAFAWSRQPAPLPMRAVVAAVQIGAAVVPARSGSPRVAIAPTTPPAPATPAAPAITPTAPAITPTAPSIAPAIAAPASPPASHPRRARPTPAPVAAPADRELADYAVAHRLHFQDRDCAGAVRAWDAYLSAWPAGQLAPEARFNRAVCLVRLERWTDADAALRALAEDPATARRADVDRLRALVDSKL